MSMGSKMTWLTHHEVVLDTSDLELRVLDFLLEKWPNADGDFDV